MISKILSNGAAANLQVFTDCTNCDVFMTAIDSLATSYFSFCEYSCVPASGASYYIDKPWLKHKLRQIRLEKQVHVKNMYKIQTYLMGGWMDGWINQSFPQGKPRRSVAPRVSLLGYHLSQLLPWLSAQWTPFPSSLSDLQIWPLRTDTPSTPLHFPAPSLWIIDVLHLFCVLITAHLI